MLLSTLRVSKSGKQPWLVEWMDTNATTTTMHAAIILPDEDPATPHGYRHAASLQVHCSSEKQADYADEFEVMKRAARLLALDAVAELGQEASDGTIVAAEPLDPMDARAARSLGWYPGLSNLFNNVRGACRHAAAYEKVWFERRL